VQPDELDVERDELDVDTPQIADPSYIDDPTDDPSGDDADEGDVEEVELELEDEDLGGDLFDGVEDAQDADTDASGDVAGGEGIQAPDDDGGEGDEDEEPDAVADGLEGNAEAMEDAINDGAARLAVVGLQDDDLDDDMATGDLEAEFVETFEAFRLGYYGSRVVDEYLLAPDEEEVNPAWGLAGSALMALAMAVWLRPDGAEKVRRARESIEGLADGIGGTE
jgi:hypothetical protein